MKSAPHYSTHSKRSWAKVAALIPIVAFNGMVMPDASAAFGLIDEGKSFVVDSGAGLVLRVNKSSGDVFSIRYKGGPELLESKRRSHIASGLGAAKVTGTVLGGNTIKISIATDEANGSAKSLTHYLIVRNGVNNVYMATFPTFEPRVGELRWITRLEKANFPSSPMPSDLRGGVRAIESADVYALPDGTTRSKYFGDTQSRGKDRAMDLSYCGISGPGVGVWMAYGNRESSSGGPFFRDIQNQTAEVYNYMNSGHNQTESVRVNVLHGPYALVFTDGQVPQAPVDYSWIEKAGLDLKGFVPNSLRGSVSGVAAGVQPGLRGMVGFSNATAQYWTPVGANGIYASPLMKPGTYEAKLYQGELVVASNQVTVQSGANGRLDLSATPIPAPLFRIGEWDGTPLEFLNGNKIVTMHPSDPRMGPWGPVTHTVGVDSAAKFPALQLRKVNSPTTIKFTLSKEQIANRTLRIGITCGYGGGRPVIKVNQWEPKRAPGPVTQPNSRSFTIGTYRGNNFQFTYTIPAGAFVIGENILTINPLSGTKDLSQWLSAGWAYDAIQLDAAPVK